VGGGAGRSGAKFDEVGLVFLVAGSDKTMDLACCVRRIVVVAVEIGYLALQLDLL